MDKNRTDANAFAPPEHAHTWDLWAKGQVGEENRFGGCRFSNAYPLPAHLLDTVLTAEAVWDLWLSENLKEYLNGIFSGQGREVSLAVAGCHDVGKANPLFQFKRRAGKGSLEDVAWAPKSGFTPLDERKLPAYLDARWRHEFVSHIALAGQAPDGADPLSEFWFAAVCGGHHGNWVADSESDPEVAEYANTQVSGEEWDPAQQNLVGLVSSLVTGGNGFHNAFIAAEGKDLLPAIILLTGLTVLADWLSSSDQIRVGGHKQLEEHGTPITPGEWTDARRDEVHAYVRETLAVDGVFNNNETATGQIERAILGEMDPRVIQQVAMDDVGSKKGLWVVTCPMGEGKTEAALLRHVAQPGEHLMIALPTQTTTDSMANRLRKQHTGLGFTIAHQYAAYESNLLGEANPAVPGYDWFSSSNRRLAAPLSVVTVDQVLSGALPRKHAALRLLCLANHHVVVDEVHTLDHYQQVLLVDILSWLGVVGARVTLLSATLSRGITNKFVDAYLAPSLPEGTEGKWTDRPHQGYPWHGVFAVSSDGQRVVTSSDITAITKYELHVDVKATEQETRSEHVAWIRETRKASNGSLARIGVIRNTIGRAISVAEEIKHDPDCGELIVLHSRMTKGHRSQTEQKLINALAPDRVGEAPVTVIATQVAELSLDIDCDFLATDLAPGSSLMQRAGRLQRNLNDSFRRERFSGMTVPKRVLRVVHNPSDYPLPYHAGDFSRALAGIEAAGGHIQVTSGVQEFIESCVFSLEPDGSNSSTSEVIEIIEHGTAANQSRNHLADALNPENLRISESRYERLCSLTTGAEVQEELMRTRFIDMPTRLLFLYDSAGDQEWACGEVGGQRGPGIPGALSKIGNASIGQHIRYLIPANIRNESRKGRDLTAAIEASHESAGVCDWEPVSHVLNQVECVDVRELKKHNWFYDNVFGLCHTSELGKESPKLSPTNS